jgi:hypothetical protein
MSWYDDTWTRSTVSAWIGFRREQDAVQKGRLRIHTADGIRHVPVRDDAGQMKVPYQYLHLVNSALRVHMEPDRVIPRPRPWLVSVAYTGRVLGAFATEDEARLVADHLAAIVAALPHENSGFVLALVESAISAALASAERSGIAAPSLAAPEVLAALRSEAACRRLAAAAVPRSMP